MAESDEKAEPLKGLGIKGSVVFHINNREHPVH